MQREQPEQIKETFTLDECQGISCLAGISKPGYVAVSITRKGTRATVVFQKDNSDANRTA